MWMDRSGGTQEEEEVLTSGRVGPELCGIGKAVAMWPAGRGMV